MTKGELLETSVVRAYKMGYGEVQVLSLLILARTGRAMQLAELAAEMGRHRQRVAEALNNFQSGEVKIERTKQRKTLIQIEWPGVEVLRDILQVKR